MGQTMYPSFAFVQLEVQKQMEIFETIKKVSLETMVFLFVVSMTYYIFTLYVGQEILYLMGIPFFGQTWLLTVVLSLFCRIIGACVYVVVIDFLRLVLPLKWQTGLFFSLTLPGPLLVAERGFKRLILFAVFGPFAVLLLPLELVECVGLLEIVPGEEGANAVIDARIDLQRIMSLTRNLSVMDYINSVIPVQDEYLLLEMPEKKTNDIFLLPPQVFSQLNDYGEQHTPRAYEVACEMAKGTPDFYLPGRDKGLIFHFLKYLNVREVAIARHAACCPAYAPVVVNQIYCLGTMCKEEVTNGTSLAGRLDYGRLIGSVALMNDVRDLLHVQPLHFIHPDEIYQQMSREGLWYKIQFGGLAINMEDMGYYEKELEIVASVVTSTPNFAVVYYPRIPIVNTSKVNINIDPECTRRFYPPTSPIFSRLQLTSVVLNDEIVWDRGQYLNFGNGNFVVQTVNYTGGEFYNGLSPDHKFKLNFVRIPNSVQIPNLPFNTDAIGFLNGFKEDLRPLLSELYRIPNNEECQQKSFNIINHIKYVIKPSTN